MFVIAFENFYNRVQQAEKMLGQCDYFFLFKHFKIGLETFLLIVPTFCARRLCLSKHVKKIMAISGFLRLFNEIMNNYVGLLLK